MAEKQETPFSASPVSGIEKPLAGLRIVEIGHFIAAPFAARLLGDLGAEIIKVEPPVSGDPSRGWGLAEDGKSIWWPVHGRNKKSIAIDIKSSEGREIALGLIASADAVIENFRPGQFDRWGLSEQAIRAVNPSCVIVHLSGFGQTGSKRDKVAFGVIGEAMGGLRHLTAYPPGTSNLPPIRTGVSLSDSVAALYAVIGLLAALHARGKGREAATVDVALYEAIFSLLEGCLPEFGKLGVVRQPTGSTLPTNAPSNAYLCGDGAWICIAGNSDRIFGRLMTLIERPELSIDPRFATNWGRVENAEELDLAIGRWTAGRTAQQAMESLDAEDVPASLVYTIADCVQDPHFHERGMITTLPDKALGEILHPGVVPMFNGERLPIGTSGPELGADTDALLEEILGFDSSHIRELKQKGVVQ